MTTKQRAYLKGLAMTIEPIFQCGKSSVTPEFIQAVAEALEKRELIFGDRSRCVLSVGVLCPGTHVPKILHQRGSGWHQRD